MSPDSRKEGHILSVSKIQTAYRGQCEGMPLDTRYLWAVKKDVLAWLCPETLLVHLKLYHTGWMHYNLVRQYSNSDTQYQTSFVHCILTTQCCICTLHCRL